MSFTKKIEAPVEGAQVLKERLIFFKELLKLAKYGHDRINAKMASDKIKELKKLIKQHDRKTE